MKEGAVPAIFARQTTTGQWADEHSYYTPKYVSTHWSMMLLDELCADPADERFQRGVNYMLGASIKALDDWQASEGTGFTCLWGNILRYTFYAGQGDDARTRKMLDFATRDIIDGHCKCRMNGYHSCAWGVVRTLWGLAAITPDKRNPQVQRAIDQGLTFLLDSFSLINANYPTPDDGDVHPLWFKLNFPLFYQVDILFTLRVLAELGALDHPAVQTALDWLESLRLKNGRWRGRSPYRQRTWRELGGGTETSRWITLQVATILQQAGRLDLREVV